MCTKGSHVAAYTELVKEMKAGKHESEHWNH